MTIETLLDELIGREGGYVNDPRDAGGETIWGITIATARANGFTGAMRTMTREQAKAIYRSQYWIRPRFSEVEVIYPLVAEELLDTGVNMGVRKAGEFLQVALNALNNQGRDYADIGEDGAVGNATLGAIRAYKAKRGAEGQSVLLKALNCLQGARYIELSRLRSANESFVYGWLRTRVA
jgi:lysozyme family protein